MSGNHGKEAPGSEAHDHEGAEAGTGGREGRNPKWWVVGIAALVVVVLAAYLLWPRKPEHVLVVGDSVSYMSIQAIQGRFGSDTSVEAITRPGFTSSDLLPVVTQAIDARQASGKKLDRAVFLVGYNDVMHDAVDTADLKRLVEQSDRYECATWLTLPARPGGEPAGNVGFDPDRADAWNQRLEGLVTGHRNLHLVTDWQRAVEEAPADAYLSPDGVHPDPPGQEKLAQVMVDTLLSECRFA